MASSTIMQESTTNASRTFEVSVTPPLERLNKTRVLVEKRKHRVSVVRLVAFAGVPEAVEFEDVPLGKVAVRRIVVQNPNNKTIVASVEEPRKAMEVGFDMDYVDLKLESNEECELRIGWAPRKSGKVHAKLSIKYGASKIYITLLGSCKDPDEHKPRTLRMMKEATKNRRAASRRAPKAPTNPVERFDRGIFAPTRAIGAYMADDNTLEHFSSVLEGQQQVEALKSLQDVSALDSNGLAPNETFVVASSESLRSSSPPSNSRNDIRRETFLMPASKLAPSSSFVSSTPHHFKGPFFSSDSNTKVSAKDAMVHHAADFSAIKTPALMHPVESKRTHEQRQHVSKELVFQDVTNTIVNNEISFNTITTTSRVILVENNETVSGVLDHLCDKNSTAEDDINVSDLVKQFIEDANALKENEEVDQQHLTQLKMLEAAITIQKAWRQYAWKKQFDLINKRQGTAAVTLQAALRRFLARRRYLAVRKACVKLQSHFRRIIAKRAISTLREQRYTLSALVIQRRWRAHCEHNRFLEVKKACRVTQRAWRLKLQQRRRIEATIVIQKWWRRYRCVKSYGQQLAAIRCVQNQWRRKLKRKFRRQEALRHNEAAIVIQSVFRMHMFHRGYKTIRNAVLFIQLRWRFLHKRRLNAALVIQKWFKTVRAQKDFQKLRFSATVVQRKWRARQKKKRSQAAISIQKGYRQYQQQKKFHALKRACIFLQFRWKFTLYLRRRKLGAELIQKNWRCFIVKKSYKYLRDKLLFLQQRWKFLLARKQRQEAAIVLQSAWRRKEQVLKFRQLKRAALLLQRRWRLKKQMERCQTAVLCLQKSWRCFLLKRSYMHFRAQCLFIQQRWKFMLNIRRRQTAAIVIQKNWKMHLVVRRLRVLNISALIIQKNFLSFKTKKHFDTLKCRTLIIQRWWRTRAPVLRRRRQEREERAAITVTEFLRAVPIRQRFLHIKRACLVIQKFFRGNRTRRALRSVDEHRRQSVLNRDVSLTMANDIERVRENVLQANRNASSGRTLGNVTAFALEYLYSCKSITGILQVLKDLDFSTQHSAVCMDHFLVRGDVYVGILVDVASRCNRSIPHIDIISVILDVLINVSKCDDGRETLGKDGENVISVLLRLMKIYQDKAQIIFSKSCAVLWSMAHQSMAVEVLRSEENGKCLKSLRGRQEAHHKRSYEHERARQLRQGTTRSTTKERMEPSVSLSLMPPWQLNAKVVRYHKDPLHAINVLLSAIAKKK